MPTKAEPPKSPGDSEPPPTTPKPRRAKLSRRAKQRPLGEKGQGAYPANTINPLFKCLLYGDIGVGVLSILIFTALGFWGKEPPTQLQTDLDHMCNFIITTTFGTLVGLLGGGVARPNTFELADKKPG